MDGPQRHIGEGRYRIERLIGEGSKKRVHLAHDTVLGRDVGRPRALQWPGDPAP